MYSTEDQRGLLSFEHYKENYKPEVFCQEISIQKSSCRLIKDSSSDMLAISFVFSTKSDGVISIYFFAQEFINTDDNIQYFSLDPRSPTPTIIDVFAGESQELMSSFTLNLSLFNENEKNFKDFATIPICIAIETPQITLVNYMKIDGNALIDTKKMYWKFDEVFEVKDIFYMDHFECTLCLMEHGNIMLVPCRHVCLCQKCFDMLQKTGKKCPICRNLITTGYNISS